MKTIFKIGLAVVCTITAILIIALVAGMWFLNRLGDAFLGPAPKPPVGMIGFDMNTDTATCQTFISRATGIQFPNGTQVDAYDGGFDMMIACFTLPEADVATFLTNNLTLSPTRPPVRMEGLGSLTSVNQSLPTQLLRARPTSTNVWPYQVFLLYSTPSRRLWVECHYRGWNE